MRAGEVDDHRVGGRVECRGGIVVEAEEDHIDVLAGCLGIRHEGGQRPVQARIERACGPAGERVGAERDELELRVPEHAVERLLAGIAGAAEDGGALHTENYTDKCKLCSGDRDRGARPEPAQQLQQLGPR